MGALAELSAAELEVEPGRTATATVTVRNTGSVVDRFTFEGIGGSAEWTTFTPESLSLFPGANGAVAVVFAPPRRSDVPAGATPFGIKVSSTEDPEGAVVEEGTIRVAPFSDVTVELLPRITRGRRAGRARLAIDNRSNCALRAELSGADPGGVLDIGFNPAGVEVLPGSAQFVRVRLKPKVTFWRGPTATRPYRLSLNTQPLPATPPPTPTAPQAEDDTTETPVATFNPHPPEIPADGSMLQEALLPPWLVKALIAVLVLLALLAVLWYAFVRPQIRSTAQNEVSKQLAADGVAPGSANGGGGSGAGGGGTVTTSPTTTASSATGGTVAPPTTVASSSSSSPSSSGGQTINGTGQLSANGTRDVYSVGGQQELQVTDLLVENPAGSSGTVEIARSGTILMEWSLANFRDLDYHWIQPTLFGPGSQMQLIVSGCSTPCSAGIYFAGNLVKSP